MRHLCILSFKRNIRNRFFQIMRVVYKWYYYIAIEQTLISIVTNFVPVRKFESTLREFWVPMASINFRKTIIEFGIHNKISVAKMINNFFYPSFFLWQNIIVLIRFFNNINWWMSLHVDAWSCSSAWHAHTERANREFWIKSKVTIELVKFKRIGKK